MKRSKQVTFGIGGEYVDPSQNILYILGAQANPSIVLMPVLFDYSVSPPAILIVWPSATSLRTIASMVSLSTCSTTRILAKPTVASAVDASIMTGVFFVPRP